MKPISETSEVVEGYGPFAADDGDMLAELEDKAARVREVVPDCIGISLASQEHGISFTLVASDEEMAGLDAVQYVSSGPCVESVKADRVVQYSQDELFEEAGWRLFAQATAAAAVASTLTLPIVVAGQVAGSINLYAATPDAFTGRHQQIAAIFDAWAPGAVANADLDFSTRKVAERAPHILQREVRMNVALGILMTHQHVDIHTARARLHEAAQRAGTTVTILVEKLISDTRRGDRDQGRRATGDE